MEKPIEHVTKTINIVNEEAAYCPTCNKLCEEVITKVPIEDNTTFFETYGKIKLKYCRNCKKYFISKERSDKINHSFPKFRYRSVEVLSKKEIERLNSTNNNKTNNAHKYNIDEITYIIVYKHHCSCLGCERNHHFPVMKNYALYVNNIEGDTVSVPVFQCNVCGRFFVSEDVLRRIEKNHGMLLFERRSEAKEFGIKEANYEHEYAEDTILSRCGYSTQIESPEMRQYILEFILNTGRATKAEICDILSCFIYQRSSRCYIAKPRWEKDLEYISKYKIEQHPKIYKFEFIEK